MLPGLAAARLAGLLLALLLGLAACANGPPGASAFGQACALDRLASFPIETRANLLFVQVQIDGKPARLLVDTGADRSMVTESAAQRLALARNPRRLTRLEGVGGVTTNWEVKTESIVFGGAKVRDFGLTVGRFAQDEIAGVTVDGLLGVDILAAFDVEIDPVRGQVTLYGARPCPDVLPPWRENFLVVESTGPLRGRILVPITLDGVNDMAVLDTGAQVTSVSERLALSTGLTRQELDRDPGGRSQGASANAVITRAHRFRSLQIGQTLIKNPVLAVLQLPEGRAGALLGANYLRGRRLWLSFASRRFFLAEPGG
jgi:predicted aspartyl protease